MAKMGRPEIYATQIEPYLDQIAEWYKTMTVRQIAAKLGVSKTSLYKYAKEYPELQAALDNGKAGLVDDLQSAIKKKALGYTYEETTVKVVESDKNGYEQVTTTVTKHMPPDLGSIHLLLKNLDPNWHDADMTTIKLKKKELALKEKRAEDAAW